MLAPRLDLRQSQSLVMTPQLQLAIKLLALSNQDVAAVIEAELEQNPLLEIEEQGATPEPGDPPPPDTAPDPVAAEPTGFDDAAPEPDSYAATEANSLPEEGPLDAEGAATDDRLGPSDGEPGFGTATAHDGADDPGIENRAAAAPPLRERLAQQLRLAFADPVDQRVAAHLLALLEPSGRLGAEPAAIAAALGVPLARVEAIRATMMRFEPVGMFARSLAECLAAQLAEQNRLDPAMQALLDHLDLLARRDLAGLIEVCGVDREDIADMAAELRRLDPKPGAGEGLQAAPIVPDILMRAGPDGAWLLELNPETLPRLLVNQGFCARIMPRASREERAFLNEKLQTANWLVKSLQQRAQTILKVAGEIVAQQDGFFRLGVLALRPLTLREVAAAVDLHESTVSRVTSNKYIATPRGNFELKYFFTTAIPGSFGGEAHSAEAIRHRIRAMVGAETAETILSDDAIVTALRGEGVDIARRTVAKYRDALGIASSVQRKREKSTLAW